jgi:hypothetical protein
MVGAVAASALCGPRASAFELDGHYIIEAVAYRRLLGLAKVPGTEVSGRELLAALIAAGVLAEPRCFDHERPRDSCGAQDRRERPLTFWPWLGAGAADIINNRQLSARGQCQHFMAQTTDGLSAPDPRSGVPAALVTQAYARCVTIVGAVFDGILRDPRLARERLAGMYVLMHAIQDSFSAAHVARDDQGRIVHLLSWTLVDWPSYLIHGRGRFPPETHHAITDRRDADYLKQDALAPDGQSCAAFPNPYAVPETCLTPRARAAVDAIVDLLVLTYQLRTRAAAVGRQATLSSPEDLVLWQDYVQRHLASDALRVEGPLPQLSALPRPDAFLGVQGSIARDGWGTGAWAAQLFYGPALPFALALAAGVGFERRSGSDGVVGALGLGLYLPLVRRFSIGVTPAGVALRCDTGFESCDTTLVATLGELLIPLPYWACRGRAGRGTSARCADRSPPWRSAGRTKWRPPAGTPDRTPSPAGIPPPPTR